MTGQLAVIFYDRRDDPGNSLTTTYMATSNDGGATWEDFRVGDVSFTPTPISGLAGGYMGDYLGIAMVHGVAYPTWSDDRTARLWDTTQDEPVRTFKHDGWQVQGALFSEIESRVLSWSGRF